MRNGSEKLMKVNPKILKIESKSDDCYQVYFDFLNVPVKMNKGYLETITNHLA